MSANYAVLLPPEEEVDMSWLITKWRGHLGIKLVSTNMYFCGNRVEKFILSTLSEWSVVGRGKGGRR